MIHKKMENGSKLLISDFIIKNRFCLAFITVIVFLFIYGSVSYAYDYTSGGSRSSVTVSQYYEMDSPYPYFTGTDISNYIIAQGISMSNIQSTAVGASGISDADFGSGTNTFGIVTSSGSVNGNSNYHLFTKSSNSNYHELFSMSFIGYGNFALVCGSYSNRFVISDSPFYIMGLHNNSLGNEWYFLQNENTISANGFYCFLVDGYENIVLSEMPLYLATNDGSSGFTNISTSATDFSFSGNNMNFNYLIEEGYIADPNAPQEVESDAKYNLTFRDNTYYSGSGLNQFWHNNNFTFTEYQINNPVNYRLKFSYKIDFANNLGVNDSYYYTPSDDVQLAYFLGQSNRLGTGSRIAVPLSSDWFKNGSNQTLTSAIIGTINAVTGTDVQYINPNGLFENIIDWAVTVDNYVFGDGSGSPLQVVTNRYDGVITKFKIYGEVSIYNDVNSNYESFSYKDSHNFLTGNGQVISTDNTIAPYENSPAPVYTAVPSTGGGGGISAGTGSAVATIQKGAVQVNVNSGSSLTPAFQIDDVNIANVAQTMNDVVSFFGNDRNENGFWALMKSVYDYLPAEIWTAIAVGVSTVLGISIVKVTLSYVRK